MTQHCEAAPDLRALILAEFRADGPITFDRYMDLFLYHPQLGYYSRQQPHIGPDGDYYTSTDVSPLFGATIGRQLREMWEVLERPRPFAILEYGAGKGLLAADVLGWAGAAHPDFYAAIEYHIVELSPSLRRYQQERLGALPIRWAESGAPPDGVIGCALSNEVADALPFHRVRQVDGALWELWVVESDGTLREEPGAPSTPALASYLHDAGVDLREGHTAEINLRAAAWMRAQLATLRAGFALTIDYGATADRLYGDQYPEGTLACYHRHTRNTEPFERVGEQDITAHVDFSALARAVRGAGAEVTGYTTQGYFLASLGLGDALAGDEQRHGSAREFERERAAIEQLIRPDGLGGFRVLIAHRGIERPSLRGLAFGAEPL
ncbi:MAG: SAM-dependent methyltransferase [Chloroflexota bacterium]|nr:SAM-dependent methyltransferase [Chloroflexota bacterium]